VKNAGALRNNSPYCSDALSLPTVLVDIECFRFYSKGLVSEESVRDMKITVVEAGVAICNLRDSLMLEVRKNLETLLDDQVVTNEVAEQAI
jgi:hypothetical protein